MDSLKDRLRKPELKFRPELRWWLAEGLHTDETLKAEVDAIFNAGFGGVEFLAMDEAGADSSRYGWGSEEWVHDSQLLVEETTRRGMGVSLTSGTNWATANLTNILPDDKAAAKELNFVFETVAAGQSRSGPLFRAHVTQPGVHEQILVAVVAGRRVSRTQMGAVLDEKSLGVLTDRVKDGCLDWTAPADGIYELMTFWMHGTAQTATPAKGIAYTVNYVDRCGVDAVIKYWNDVVLTPELREQISKNDRVQMYMDSLELTTSGKGGQFWGYCLLDEFKKRRGYDLTPYLPYIVRPYDRMMIGLHHHNYEPADACLAQKIRNDLCQTQTDLYIDNMLKPFKEWLNKRGITLRAEISYGMPYEISLPGKHVDAIEGESLDFASQPEAFRALAGVAFLIGRPYSSETAAHRHNHMVGLGFTSQIIFTQFVSGVSRTVLHGYSSIRGAEISTKWPGHEGMWPTFSDRFDVRQPFWRHIGEWTDMLARFQMILREGAPKRDLLILRLDYHFNGKLHRLNGIQDRVIYETMYLRANKGVYWQDMSLQNTGYTYDYTAPQLLEEPEVSFREGMINPDGPAYRAVLVYQEALPLSTAKKLLEWARQGLRIVLVNNVTEMIRNEINLTHRKAASETPYNDGGEAELARVIAELKRQANVRELDEQAATVGALEELGVKPRSRFAQPNAKVMTFTRDAGDTRYLLLYHYMYQDTAPFSFTVAMEGEGKPSRLNCWEGTAENLGAYERGGGYTNIPLTLAPGEATVIALQLNGTDELHAVAADCEVLRRDGALVAFVEKSGEHRFVLSDGRRISKTADIPAEIDLTEWALTVEDWNEGEKRVVTEDRGLGYESREVYYETKKTPIYVGKTALKPWRDIPAVGDQVSGIGEYEAEFGWPQDWAGTYGAKLKIESTNDASLEIYVNGQKSAPVDYAKLETDISALLKPGKNSVRVVIATNLCNRLISRGYYIGEDDTSGTVVSDGKRRTVVNSVLDYGMVGKVCIKPYAAVRLD